MAATKTRRAPAKRAPAKRSAPKRPAPKRPAAKRPAAKRPASKRPAARRPPAKRAARRPAAKRRPLRAGLTWRAKLAALAAVMIAAGAGYVFWLRDSSLVAINDVEVVGGTTSDRGEIVGALTDVAEKMTTLHYDAGRIEAVAERFPTVASVSVDPNFPHGMRLEVEQRPPRLFAVAGGEQVPVAADGTLLPGLTVPDDEHLPILELDQLPPGGTLGGDPLAEAEVIGNAPDPLLGLIEQSEVTQEYGVVLTMRGGIEVRFGSADRADDKWAAAAAVLADPKLDAATYVDVRVPERPAAGGAG